MSTLNTTNIKHPSSASNNIVLDSSARVGIGTASPATSLHLLGANTPARGQLSVTGNSDVPRMTLYRDGTFIGGIQGDTTNGTTILAETGYSITFNPGGGSEKGRFDSSGRLLVGTSSSLDSNALLQLYKSSGSLTFLVDSDSLSDGTAVISRISGGTGSGDFGVYKHSGIASPCVFLDLQAQDGASNYYWTDNSDILRTSTNSANIGTTGGTVVGTQTSDERIKDILGPVEYGLETIKQIESVRFALKSEPGTERLGFIAQQVQPLVPQSVFDTNEHIEGEPEDAPTKLGMEYVALIPVLVNAIKELSAEVDALKAQLV